MSVIHKILLHSGFSKICPLFFYLDVVLKILRIFYFISKASLLYSGDNLVEPGTDVNNIFV